MIKLGFALALATLVSGCGCGAFNGAGDRVYMRGADSLMLCENGGFVVQETTGTIEGSIVTDPTSGIVTGVEGDDHETVFTLDDEGNGTVDTTGFGDAAWTQMDLDQTALDHADVQCSDLTTRAWWGAS
jgi:hypothetical protein